MQPIWSSVTLPVSETNTRVRSGWLSPGTMLVALPADTKATRLASCEIAMSTARTMPAIAGPLRVLPSEDTIVTAGWMMPLHASGPP